MQESTYGPMPGNGTVPTSEDASKMKNMPLESTKRRNLEKCNSCSSGKKDEESWTEGRLTALISAKGGFGGGKIGGMRFSCCVAAA